MDAGAAFWIFLAVMVGVGAWAGARKEAEKQETLRRLLDRHGTLEEPQLRELLRSFERPPPAWQSGMPFCEPPDTRRQFAVAGAIFMCIGVALTAFFGLFYLLYSFFGPAPAPENAGERVAFIVGIAIGLSVVVLGAGVFLVRQFYPVRARAAAALDTAASSPGGTGSASSSTSDAPDRFSR